MNINKGFVITIVFAFMVVSCNNKEKQNQAESKLVMQKMPDGTINVIGAMINGKKEGLWIKYDDSGRLSSQETYIHDSLTGESINYHDDGKTISSKGRVVNNQMEGEWIFYYNANTIAQKGNYENGNQIGIWEYYTLEGKLDKKVEYLKDGTKRIIQDNHQTPSVPNN